MALSERNLRFFRSVDGLGGPVTSAPVTEELLPTIRGLEAEKGMTDYVCIYFVNLDPHPEGVIDPEIFLVEKPGTRSVVSLGVDPAGKNGTAQEIGTRLDPPFQVTFVHSSVSVTYKLPDGPYYQNDRVPIWIRREVPKGVSPGDEGFRLIIRGESF